MSFEIHVPADEKRQVIGIIHWNPTTNELQVSVVDSIPCEEALALLKKYNFHDAKVTAKKC